MQVLENAWLCVRLAPDIHWNCQLCQQQDGSEYVKVFVSTFIGGIEKVRGVEADQEEFEGTRRIKKKGIDRSKHLKANQDTDRRSESTRSRTVHGVEFRFRHIDRRRSLRQSSMYDFDMSKLFGHSSKP